MSASRRPVRGARKEKQEGNVQNVQNGQTERDGVPVYATNGVFMHETDTVPAYDTDGVPMYATNEKNVGDPFRETQPKKEKEGVFKKFGVLSLIFFTVSFLGWCIEVVFCSSGFTKFCDRGFLTLPFCVIYGAPLCLVYLVLGTPNEGRLHSLCAKSKNAVLTCVLSYGLYFLPSAAIATLFELTFGFLFDRLGVRLWDYSYKRVHFKGYICPSYSLLWGVLITLSMRTVFPLLYRLFCRIPARLSVAVSLVLWVAVGVDFSLNFALLLTSLIPLRQVR